MWFLFGIIIGIVYATKGILGTLLVLLLSLGIYAATELVIDRYVIGEDEDYE